METFLENTGSLHEYLSSPKVDLRTVFFGINFFTINIERERGEQIHNHFNNFDQDS